MQVEPEFRLDGDDTFSLCSQPASSPLTIMVPSTPLLFHAFTPTCGQSGPHEFINLGFHDQEELIAPSEATDKLIFGPFNCEPGYVPLLDALPHTPIERGHLGFDCEHAIGIGMAHHGLMGPTQESMLPTYGYSRHASKIIPIQSQRVSRGISETISPWPCTSDNRHCFVPDTETCNGLGLFRVQQHSRSSIGYSPPSSPDCIRDWGKSILDELQKDTIGSSERRPIKLDLRQDAPAGKFECDYPNCFRMFKRKEHLKRHKQSYHNRDRFCCEFCGRDRFNRQDNLDNHRRLHARPNNGNHRVKFDPHAVSIIEQEKQSKKIRAPSNRTMIDGKQVFGGRSQVR